MKRSLPGRELSREEVAYLRHKNRGIAYLQLCPKAASSNSGIRYEGYKSATSFEAFLAQGGTLADFKYDYARKYVTLNAGETDALEGFREWVVNYAPVKAPRAPKPPKPATATNRGAGAEQEGSSAVPLPEQPPRKRLRSVHSSKALANDAPPAFSGCVEPLAHPVLEFEGPVTLNQLRTECIEPSQPALLRGAASDTALACCASVSALRAALGPEALSSEVEVAVAPRGGTFFGDDLRREAAGMPLGDFLALLDHSADTFQGQEDFYLAQCPFLLPQGSHSSPPPPLAPLAAALRPPTCLMLASPPSSKLLPVDGAPSSTPPSAMVETFTVPEGSTSVLGSSLVEAPASGNAIATESIALSVAPAVNPASMSLEDDVTRAEVLPSAADVASSETPVNAHAPFAVSALATAETFANPVASTTHHVTETADVTPQVSSVATSVPAASACAESSVNANHSMANTEESSAFEASKTAANNTEVPTTQAATSDSPQLPLTDGGPGEGGGEAAYPLDLEGNLWACHRAASTSTHFDSRHNLLVVLKGHKSVTLWSPAESKRLMPGCNGHAAAATAGVAEAVTQSLASKSTLNGTAASDSNSSSSSSGSNNLSKSSVEQVGWPTHALLGKGDGAGVVVEVQAGDALFIPEGWWHQVNSTAGTIAANYWFNGLHSAVVESAPHVAPYLLRTLANSMLDTARASLVRACRAESRGGQPSVRVSVGDIQESPQATTAAMYRPLDVTSVGALTAALVSDPAETIMHIGRHMPLPTMVSILPQVVAAAPSAFAAAVEKASPWAAELLVGCFALVSHLPSNAVPSSSSSPSPFPPSTAAPAPASSTSSSSSLPAPAPPLASFSFSPEPNAAAAFYDALFEPLGSNADAVRATLLRKQGEFGRRLMPLLLRELGILEPPSASPEGGSFANDMNEVRALLVMLETRRSFMGAGPDVLA